MSGPSHTPPVHRDASATGEATLLQRKCACGQHTPDGGECEECRKKRTGTLQRSAVRPSAMEEAPPIVHEVLRSPGQPLDASAREALEPRFGRDFSRVPLRASGSSVLQRKRASSRKEMRDFLTELKEPDFEGDRKSDRKSREIVERATELGPLSIDDKVRLCKEMIEGITTKREENAILDLLRSTPSSQERQRIAACAGSREEFLSNFSFARRRAAEAMTLLASDFTPQRESHLVTLPPGRLDEYIAAAMDTDVKARLEKIRLWQKISTPFPLGTKPDAKGAVPVTINDVEVTFLPDVQDASFSRDEKGGTSVQPDYSQARLLPNGRVVGFRYIVQTTYGFGSKPNRRAGYGRGKAPDDVEAGTTSLRFHEGMHGQAVLDFIQQNPLPNFMQLYGQPNAAQDVRMGLCVYTRNLDSYIFTQVDLPEPSIPGGKPPAPRPCP
jgi:hypothetical protein